MKILRYVSIVFVLVGFTLLVAAISPAMLDGVVEIVKEFSNLNWERQAGISGALMMTLGVVVFAAYNTIENNKIKER